MNRGPTPPGAAPGTSSRSAVVGRDRRSRGRLVVTACARVTLGAACFTLAAAPEPASASEYWDEVKIPGLARYRADVDAARHALGARRPEEAATIARAAMGRFPDRTPAKLVLARAEATSAHLDAALDLLEDALSSSSTALDAPSRAANREPASTGARQAVSADSDEPTAIGEPLAHEDDVEDLAVLALGADRPALAIRLLAPWLARLEPSLRRSHWAMLLADAELASGPARLDDAIAHYREAFGPPPERTGRAVVGLALALHRRGDVDGARALVADAPPSSTTIVADVPLPVGELAARRGLVAWARGRRQEAVAELTRAARGAAWGDHARRFAASLEAATVPP